jgi:uncharacterized membrane protein
MAELAKAFDSILPKIAVTGQYASIITRKLYYLYKIELLL